MYPEWYFNPTKTYIFNNEQISQIVALVYQDVEQLEIKEKADVVITKILKNNRRINMRKIITVVLILVCIMICFTGCLNKDSSKTHKSYTFSVDTGDKVNIKFDITNGYDINSKVPFEIYLDENLLSQGAFIKADEYEKYLSIVKSDVNSKLIDSGEKDSNKYIFWSYEESEYNFAVLIDNSNTGILLGNVTSEESAKECFRRLTITIEK